MKIRVLHTESSLGWGGQEIRILSESDFLNRFHDFECSVVCDHAALLKDRNMSSSVPVNSINLSEKSLKCLFELKRHIQRVKPHICISHSSTDSWLVAIARRLWFRHIKVIRVRHVSAPVSKNPMTKWLYQSADHLVTTSDAIKSSLVHSLGLESQKITAIPTGIDVRKSWREVSPEERARAKLSLGFDNGQFIFGMISTLRSWKGHDDALRALTGLPDCHLVIVGDGPQETNIRNQIRDLGIDKRVTLVGFTSDVRSVAAAFDAYLHPSYANEGVSQSLLQAMSMGLPVIASDIGGLNEVVEDSVTGILFPARSQQALQASMGRLKESYSISHALIASARARVTDFYSLDARCGQMSELLRKSVGLTSEDF